MSGFIASLFYWTGAWVWTGVAILLATLLAWRLLEQWCPVKATRPVEPKPVDVWRMGPFLNPHQLQHPTLHVDTDDVEQAWRVIGGRAS